jgi:hypothetical protein
MIQRFITLATIVCVTLVVFLSATSLRAQTPQGLPYEWRTVAVGGGGFVSGILFHPNEPGLLYVRTDVGGAYRWDEPRQEWIALNDDIGGLDNEFMRLGVLSLAIDPGESDRLYLACGQYTWDFDWNPEAVILRSDDRGATWERTVLAGVRLGGNEDGRNTGERLLVDPRDGDLLWLGTNNRGLWRSSDRAQTWARVDSFVPTGVTLLWIDPLQTAGAETSQTIYAGIATTSGPSLQRSRDGGATWAAVPGAPSGAMPQHVDYAPVAGARYLFFAYANALGPNGATAGAVWRLDIDLDQWTNVTPAPGAWGWGGVSVDARDTATVVASTFDRWGPRDEIYRSTDGGASWTPILQTGTLDHTESPWAAASIPHWTTDVKIDPFDSTRAIFTTGYGLFETRNLGSAPTVWRFRNRGLEETVPLGIVSPPEGPPLVTTLGDIDGFRHDDLAVAPNSRHVPRMGTNRGLDFAQNVPTKMVRTYDGGTRGAYSTDGGATWSPFGRAVSNTALGGVIAISADGATIVWSQPNVLPHRSGDAGANWTPCAGAPSSSDNPHAPVSDRVNASRFYLHDAPEGRVYASVDAGATFVAGATVPRGAAAMVAVPSFEGHLWLPCRGDGLRRSTDGGASFAAVTAVEEAYAVGFGRAAPGRAHPAVFIWGSIQGVVGFFRSDDVGETWIRLNDDAHRFGFVARITGDPRVFGRVYLATSGRGVVYGDIPAALPEHAWATFEAGVSGSWTPNLRAPYPATFSASGLPDWATLDTNTGTISGTPDAAVGTIVQVGLAATTEGRVVGETRVNLVVAGAGDKSAPVNLSTRGRVGTGDEVLIPGIVVAGEAPRTFLIRAVGPTLALPGYDVAGAMTDPRLMLISDTAGEVAFNDDWGASPDVEAVRTAIAATGAFELPEGSKDAALLATLAPGVYTARVDGVDAATGVVLVEVYDTTAGGGGALSNLSARAFVGAGGEVLIPGLVLRGSGARRMLVRAVGPTLRNLGVSGALPDPRLSLVQDGLLLAANDDWSAGVEAEEIASVAGLLGAFELPRGSRDAALLATLPEGAFTIVVSGVGGSTGVALIELYLLPPD